MRRTGIDPVDPSATLEARPEAAGAVSRSATATSPICRPRSATRSRHDMPGLDGPELDALYARARPGSRARSCRELAAQKCNLRGGDQNARGVQCRSPTNSTCSTNSISCASSARCSSSRTSSARSPCRRRWNSSSRPASSRRQPGCIVAGAIETVLTICLFFGIYTAICRLHRLHPSAGRRGRHLQGDKNAGSG